MSSTIESPVISVITPSYNQAAFIEDTILSVVNQDFDAWEHIIIDGESTDGTLDIVETYARKYPTKIRWISEPDRGQADAINKGFGMARGQIVAWLNSDDAYLFASTLSEVAAAFDRISNADIIYGDAILIGGRNRLLKVLCPPAFRYDWLRRACRLIQPAVFFRRHVIEAQQLDSTIHIVLDYEFWLRLGRAYRFVHVPRLWAVDRNQPNRKIIAQHEELVRQRQALKKRYGLKTGTPAYIVRHFLDKLWYGLPSRLKGLAALPRLYRADKKAFAIALLLDNPYALIWRQMVKNNRDLL